ncbi:MAG: DUF1868 domain-containing protein [Cyanophyceae cyanobacterium]
MDETYQAYVNRVARLTLPESYRTQLQSIQSSPKFKDGQAVAFPGYSVITPPWRDDSKNSAFYSALEATQQQLVQQLQRVIVPVPPGSFHFTIADLIWNSDYQAAVRENSGFEAQLRQQIEKSFRSYQSSAGSVDWQLLGLMVRPRSVAVYLVPKDERSYEEILQIRRSIYQNAELIGLGIEQQYHFTAHITLGYFSEAADGTGDRLLETILSFNEQWLGTEPQILAVHQAQLRKFDDMMRYYRDPHWPEVNLQGN